MSKCAEISILPNSQMAYIEVFYGWSNASTLFAQIESRESRKTWKRQESRPCLAVERLETITQFNERFGQGQTSRHGIGWNHNKSVPFSKMSNKQQCVKLTEITRQEAEDKRIMLLMKYNLQNGFLNCGKLEMEMECDDLSWKKVLTQYSDRLLSFVLNSQLNTLPTPNNLLLWGSAKN